MGPAGMAPEVVQILNAAIGRSLASPDLRERFLKGGSVPAASTPEELRKFMEAWTATFGRIAKQVGLKPQ
jgi:tripartite-type tricarboxylate transporter receptor subunit TctC